MQKKYVFLASDPSSVTFVRALSELEAPYTEVGEHDLRMSGSSNADELILLFSVPEESRVRFPSRTIRVLPHHTMRGEDEPPVPHALAAYLGPWHASRAVAVKCTASFHAVHEALKHFTFRDAHGAWTGPKRKRPSRLDVRNERRKERIRAYLPL